jgi:Tellurite resistance protein
MNSDALFEEYLAELNSIETVVADPMKFKAQLKIGDDAYKSMKAAKTAQNIWDLGGMAWTGVRVAKSSAVASTFFPATGVAGLMGSLGVPLGVSGPPGWFVAAAGLATGGAYYGVIWLWKQYAGDKVDVVPRFINTPLDSLAVGFFDLMVPLAAKVAKADGIVSDDEREAIKNHCVGTWGYDSAYFDKAYTLIEENLDRYSINDLSESLREITKKNPDFNEKKVLKGVVDFLQEVADADGKLHELEAMSIEKISQSFSRRKTISIPSISLPDLPTPWKRRERSET